jgi:hypothetical protein
MQNCDTAIHSGTYPMATHQSDGVPGFPVNNVENRTDIEVHEPGQSEGCIAFDTTAAWQQFRDLINAGNNCIHNPPETINITVSYSEEVGEPDDDVP